MYQQYRPMGSSVLPLVVKNLMIINGLFFMASLLFQSRGWGDLSDYLALYDWRSSQFRPYQFVSHIFMHADISHLAYNMFALWMFGSFLENYWGPKRFLIFYVATGLGAAALYLAVNSYEIYQVKEAVDLYLANPGYEQMSILLKKAPQLLYNNTVSELMGAWSMEPDSPQYLSTGKEIAEAILRSKINTPMIGASGAVFGLLLGNAILFPNREIFLFLIPFPIKIKWLVLVLGGMELMDILGNNPLDHVAHFAHLGGMLFGFLLIKYWNKTDRSSFY